MCYLVNFISVFLILFQDKYLHTNCLAALANMSSQFKNLHPYVSQRIVSMFEALAKKYFRLMAVLSQSGSIDNEGQCSIGENHVAVTVAAVVFTLTNFRNETGLFLQLSYITLSFFRWQSLSFVRN